MFIGPFSFTDLDDVHTYGRLFEHLEDKYDRSVRVITEPGETTSEAWIKPTDTKEARSWSKYIHY